MVAYILAFCVVLILLPEEGKNFLLVGLLVVSLFYLIFCEPDAPEPVKTQHSDLAICIAKGKLVKEGLIITCTINSK